MTYQIDLKLLTKKAVPPEEAVTAWALIAVAERLERLVQLEEIKVNQGVDLRGHKI